MKATPANPTFVDARNGLLTADGGANTCLIWSAFAGRGLGVDSTTGLDTVPTASAAIPPECEPTADAGGPYVTPEGTDAVLDGTASIAGSDPSAGALTAYAWDLDDDGQYDDAAGPTPSFTTVGQDGAFTIGLEVTDAFGNTATDASTVTVTNVAPTVAIDAITPIDELGTVTVTGTVTDPGWLDDLSATISFDDGAAAVALERRRGERATGRHDRLLGAASVRRRRSASRSRCALPTTTPPATATPRSPRWPTSPRRRRSTRRAKRSTTGSAFILEAGEELTVPAGSTDPGSDDLTLTWAVGRLVVRLAQTSLVNPPATDPAKSPVGAAARHRRSRRATPTARPASTSWA